jgi:hypothetical protein
VLSAAVAGAVYQACSRGEQWMPDRLGVMEIHDIDVR